jgi:hypothetical protein
MVVDCPAIIVEVDMAESPGCQKFIEVSVEPGMATVEGESKAAVGKFRQEGGSTEMAAFPAAHVFNTDFNPVLHLEQGQLIE